MGDEDSSERVEADRGPVSRLSQSPLQVKHGDAGTEELGDVMEQQQAVPQSHDGNLLQVVVLHRYLRNTATALLSYLVSHHRPLLVLTSVQYLSGQLPGVGGFTGGPGQSVSRATGHTVDFFTLQCSHQPRPLDGVGGPVPELSLVIVPPCVNLS